jgi:phosphoglycolate phosphatase-like HAD superfamily hydrolase
MTPTLILFDLDGTLVDTAGAGRRGLERAFEEVFGVASMAGPSSRVRFNGKTDPRILADLAREAGLAEEAFAAGKDRLLAAYLRGLAEDLSRPDPRRQVIPGVRALLDALERRDDAHVGLLTGNLEPGARLKLGAFDLNRYFVDGGFSSDSEDRAEIARVAHRRASVRTGIRFAPDRTCVVGDTELDVACARANGFRAVAIASGWVPRDRLVAASPDVLLDSFEDLSTVLSALGLDGATTN